MTVQVELKVASTGLFVLAEGWNGDWDRITQGHVVTAQDANGDNILSEVKVNPKTNDLCTHC